MHAAPRASLLLSQALQALPLGHPHRVSEDGKWGREVASLIEGSTRASTHSCHFPVQPMGCLPISLHSSSSSSSSGELSNSQINSRQDLPELDLNSKINPQTPSRTKIGDFIY